ncbi:MAG: peptidylprolyl isomerase [Candidatus Magasanikbacteria bacterium]
MEQNIPQEEQPKVATPISSEVSAVSTSSENKNMKMFAIGILAILGVAIIISAGVGIYRVYAKASTDNFTLVVAKALRLPIMKVNGESVLYSNYVDDMQAIQKLVDFDKANQGAAAALTSQQMSDQVLWRLANNILVKEAAAKFNVKVETKDVEDLKANLLTQFKDQAEVEKEIQSRYGWTYAQYEEKVIKNFVLQQKIGEKISSDQKAREEIRNKALVVLNEIKAGKDFAEEAKKYGEDGTNVNGGDLGWFGKGDMVPEFENAVYALKVGEITPDLVETEYGYHIIKLDEKKTENVKDAKGKNVPTEKVKARHILFRFPTPETFLDGLAKTATFHLYVKVNNPFIPAVK